VAPATVSAGWLWKMRSAIVARVRDRNPLEVADDLGHRFGDYFRMATTRSVTRTLGFWMLWRSLATGIKHNS